MTLRSYFETTKAARQVILVDNNSDPETLEVIEAWKATGNIDKLILLDQNEGGCAFNRAAPFVTGSYVHFSENDLEYRPGWDTILLAKFDAFPRLGQLSLFGPEPESDKGEVWTRHRARRAEAAGQVIWPTKKNVTTTCIVRRKVLDAVPWTNNERPGGFRMPNDSGYSARIHGLGLVVAWNDTYVATNWGHNVEEWNSNLSYYLASYENKAWLGVDGLEERLRLAGYRFERQPDGEVVGIVPASAPGNDGTAEEARSAASVLLARGRTRLRQLMRPTSDRRR
jgi:glycosyltransferase involved in cell wall biosynthesis